MFEEQETTQGDIRIEQADVGGSRCALETDSSVDRRRNPSLRTRAHDGAGLVRWQSKAINIQLRPATVRSTIAGVLREQADARTPRFLLGNLAIAEHYAELIPAGP